MADAVGCQLGVEVGNKHYQLYPGFNIKKTRQLKHGHEAILSYSSSLLPRERTHLRARARLVPTPDVFRASIPHKAG